MIETCFKTFSSKFQNCFKVISRVFHGYLKNEDARLFLECLNLFKRKFQKYFKSISKVLLGSFKDVPRKFTELFKVFALCVQRAFPGTY